MKLLSAICSIQLGWLCTKMISLTTGGCANKDYTLESFPQAIQWSLNISEQTATWWRACFFTTHKSQQGRHVVANCNKNSEDIRYNVAAAEMGRHQRRWALMRIKRSRKSKAMHLRAYVRLPEFWWRADVLPITFIMLQVYWLWLSSRTERLISINIDFWQTFLLPFNLFTRTILWFFNKFARQFVYFAIRIICVPKYVITMPRRGVAKQIFVSAEMRKLAQIASAHMLTGLQSK